MQEADITVRLLHDILLRKNEARRVWAAVGLIRRADKQLQWTLDRDKKEAEEQADLDMTLPLHRRIIFEENTAETRAEIRKSYPAVSSAHTDDGYKCE